MQLYKRKKQNRVLKISIILASLAIIIAGGVFAVTGMKTFSSSAASSDANNLAVSAATYLGSSASTSSAADVAPDGTVVIAGVLPSYSASGAKANKLLNGDKGRIVRLNKDGNKVLSITAIGNSVDDLSINDAGNIVACGDFGVAVLNATADKVQWSAKPGAANRCDIGKDGTVVTLVNGVVYTYDAKGSALANWNPGGDFKEDVAIDGAHKLVFTAGFSNRRGGGNPVQISNMRGWNYSGKMQWNDYDFAGADAASKQLMADARAYRIALGRDGQLYLVGESAGGNSQYKADPKNIFKDAGNRIVSTDAYNTPYNTKSNHITWFGRYNPVNGDLIKGQFLLARIPEKGNQANTIRARSIAADEQGRVYLGGVSTYAIANRNAQKIGGTTVGNYQGVDTFLLVTSPDLTKRITWTTFTGTGNGHDGEVTAVNVRKGNAAIALNLKKGAFVTYRPLQAKPAGATSAYVAVWSTGTSTVAETPTVDPTETPTEGPTATATA